MKVIAFREDGWMPPNTDLRQWDHLCRAYGVELQMIDDLREAAIPPGHRVIVFDEIGEPLDEFGRPDDDAVLVFGRSGMVLTIPGADVVRIETPNRVSLFGISAGSIALERLCRG